MSMNHKITELSSSNSLHASDLFMVSRPNPNSETIYSSYKISLSSLYVDLNENFERLDDVTVNGQWNFPTNGSLYVAQKNFEPNHVINVGYAYEKFMTKLLALSSEIYNKPHIPSSIGEVIYSTTLKTLQQVQAKYGTNTIWEKIPGRFIMGASTSNIGQTAGEKDVKLTLNNIPPHTHTITMSNNEKKFQVNEPITPASESVAISNGYMEPKVNGGNLADRPIKEDVHLNSSYIGIVGEGSEDETCVKSLNAKVTIGKNSGNNIGHNNIPPFYSVHIWRRTS